MVTTWNGYGLAIWLVLAWQSVAAQQGSAPWSSSPWAEAQASQTEPWMQQSIVYRIQVFSATPLATVTPERPALTGASLERLAEPLVQSTEVRKGRNLYVANYHYALTPLTFGTVEIPATTVKITFNTPWNTPWGGGAPVEQELKVNAVSLQVQPLPSASQPWLPARALEMDVKLVPDTPLAAGDPRTLTATLRVQGGSEYQLPSLQPWLEQDGYRLYLEKQTVSTKIGWDATGLFLVGERTEVFTLLPQKDGPLTIPAIALPWWDITHKQPATAAWPGITLNLTGPIAAATPTADATMARAPTADAPGRHEWLWRIVIAVLSFGLGWWLSVYRANVRRAWRALLQRLGTGYHALARCIRAKLATSLPAMLPAAPSPSARAQHHPPSLLATAWWEHGLPTAWHNRRLPYKINKLSDANSIFATLAQFSRQHWRASATPLPAHPSLHRIAEALVHCYPTSAAPAQVNKLFQQLERSLYGQPPNALDAPSWHAQFQAFCHRLPWWQQQRQRATRGLPALNPSADVEST